MASRDPQEQRRSALRRFGIIVMALALAGCESLLPRSAPPPTETAPPPAQEEEVIREGIPEDGRHRVALLVPTSGTNAGVGQSIANAANMAILDTGGEQVRITTYDTGAAGGAMAAANRALADGSRLMLGPLLAENVRMITPAAQGADVPIIAFSNDTGVAGDGVYVMGFTPTQSIRRVTDYTYRQGARRFAALVPQGLYGQRAAASYTEAVRNLGGTMVGIRNYERTNRSLQRAVTQLNGEGEFDVLLIADSGSTAREAARYLRAVNDDSVQIIGTELWNNQPNLTSFTELRGALFASVSDRMFDTLSQRYRSRFGSNPYRLSSLGYDAALLVVRIAREWELGSGFPVSQLTSEDGFAGVDGAFRFSNGSVAERALEVQRIDASGFTVVDPAPSGF